MAFLYLLLGDLLAQLFILVLLPFQIPDVEVQFFLIFSDDLLEILYP